MWENILINKRMQYILICSVYNLAIQIHSSIKFQAFANEKNKLCYIISCYKNIVNKLQGRCKRNEKNKNKN